MQPTRYASFLKRFIAHLVDVVLVHILIGILVVPVALMFISGGVLSRFLSLQPWTIDPDVYPLEFLGMIVEIIPITFIVMLILIITLIYWFYFAVFESSSRQATPGKMMLGLFVTDIYGRRISFFRALGRTICKVLSKVFCYLGYILALFTERSQALHDLLANTLVLEPDFSPAPPMVSRPPAGHPAAPAGGAESVPPQQGPGSGQPGQP